MKEITLKVVVKDEEVAEIVEAATKQLPTWEVTIKDFDWLRYQDA